jgi:hypothetical protein
MDAAVAHAQMIPGYKDAIDLDKIKNRTFGAKIHAPVVVPEHVKEHRSKFKSPSPITYKKEDAIDKTQSPRQPKFQFSKSERKSNLEKILEKQKKWPGAGAYEVTKADRVITLGARRGYK